MQRKQEFQRGLDDALRIVERIHKDPDAFQGDAVIVPLRLLARGRRGGMTPGRWEVLDAIRSRGPFDTLQALARNLKRPMARVSQDVRALEALDLLHSVRHGKTKRIVADGRPILVA